MAVFSYTATNDSSEQVRGTLAADTPRQVRDQLRSQGLTILEVSLKTSPKNLLSLLPLRRTRRHATESAEAIRELATLLGAGIPLLESLDALVKQHRGGFRTSLQMLRERVSAGSSLAEAMRDQPDVYDSLCVQMVEVGEYSGTLDRVLDQLADFSERYRQFKDRVTASLLYPAIVLAMSVGVSMFLMTVVVPMLLDNLLDAERTLPWPTRVLKTMSDTTRVHGWWIGLVGFGLVSLFLAGIRTEKGRHYWHKILLNLPLFGPMARKQEISRVALIISTLMQSGIVFLQALETAAQTTRNVVIGKALLAGKEAVQAGRDIGEALAPSGVFPEMVIQIFTVGQQTGKLEEMLERLSENYERQVNSLATRLATVLEPILIVFLSVFVGFILFATILPILEAGNVL